MSDEQVVQTMLQRVARRLWFWRALRRLLRVTAMASAAAVGMFLASRAGLGQDVRAMAILTVAALGMVIAMIPELRRVTAVQAAHTLDATFGLGERFVTAVECLGQAGGMPRLVVQDAARWSYRLDLRRIQRAPVGRDAWVAILGVAAVSLVWLHLSGPAGLRTASDGQTDAAAIPAAPAAATRPAGPVAPSSAGTRSNGRSGLRQALGLDSGEPATRASQAAASGASPDTRRSGSTFSRAAGPGVGIGGGGATSSGGDESTAQARGARAALTSDSPAAREPLRAPGAPPDAGAAPPALQAAAGAPGLVARQGVVSGSGSGTRGQTPGLPARGGPGVGVAGDPATEIAARGADRPTGREQSANSAEARAPGSPGGQAADAVFTRMPVPPTLRQYILRYFDELRIPANGEDPS